MCASGFRSNGLSRALRRTLACGNAGQPKPKRLDPHTEQNVFAVPSGGWYDRRRASPSRIAIAFEGTRPLSVPVPPEIFLQVVQWQAETLSKAWLTSKHTPPHKQAPRRLATSRAYWNEPPTDDWARVTRARRAEPAGADLVLTPAE